MLVTTGEYVTETTKAVQSLKEEGYEPKEIAERLGISEATVSASLPYTEVFYGTAKPSHHTAAVRGYRAYQKAVLLRMQETRPAPSMEPARQEKGKQIRMGKEEKKEIKISRHIGEHVLPKGLMRTHAELLLSEHDGAYRSEALQEYAGVRRGKSISRDILVPSEMPFRSLHYCLQRAFGFQEEHLHCFEVPEENLRKLTSDKMENLLNLRGIALTQSPEIDFYWVNEPRYGGGSWKK